MWFRGQRRKLRLKIRKCCFNLTKDYCKHAAFISLTVRKKENIHKYNVNNTPNTTKFIATAGHKYSNYNNYMFRPFLVAIIRLYIPTLKSLLCTLSQLDYGLMYIISS